MQLGGGVVWWVVISGLLNQALSLSVVASADPDVSDPQSYSAAVNLFEENDADDPVTVIKNTIVREVAVFLLEQHPELVEQYLGYHKDNDTVPPAIFLKIQPRQFESCLNSVRTGKSNASSLDQEDKSLSEENFYSGSSDKGQLAESSEGFGDLPQYTIIASATILLAVGAVLLGQYSRRRPNTPPDMVPANPQMVGTDEETGMQRDVVEEVNAERWL